MILFFVGVFLGLSAYANPLADPLRVVGEPLYDAPPSEQVDELTDDVGYTLRCPVCQSMSITDSPAKTSISMKKLTREMVAAGYAPEQIQDYFVAKYGEFVLLKPRAAGLNWIIWLGPGLLLGAGLVAAGALASVTLLKQEDRSTKPPEKPPPPDDEFEKRMLEAVDRDV